MDPDRAERGNSKGGSAATAILSIRVVVEMDIESASSTALPDLVTKGLLVS